MPTNSDELIPLNARAVRVSIDLVEQLTTVDLRKPTPCADWTLHGLLTHMIAQHRGFAASARGGNDLVDWKTRPLGDDPAREYREAAEDVLTAFAEPGVLEREVALPEFSTTHRFPAARAVGFHLVDYVVHSWDVAQALGIPVHFDAEVLAAAHEVAAAVPGGEIRVAPGAAFAPEVSWSGADALDRIVAMLGRSPEWPK
ncbi:TIGR03086 family metal-binding protein [Nocardia crassostreae]|uniref:TIGR03086 family metal-binding protein n=1 Tax=Nocardia crassostreae TaxID=53428 RepID=UPI00082EE214|nr:TIGR03086 family metal-binding protein [Nocardia crassostreae]